MINELIEQIGGRERLENIASGNAFYCIQDDEGQLMARALLEVLDAKPVGEFYEYDPGDWYQRSPGDRGVKKWTPLYKVQPATSAPDGWKLMPLEPTQRMIDAHIEGMVSGGATRAYRDMLAAAPVASVNSPVIPEGWIPMPRKLTAENGAKAALSGDFTEHKFINCPECFGDDECESCDGSGRIKVEVTVSWSTIKAIWEKGAEHFATAPAPGGDGG